MQNFNTAELRPVEFARAYLQKKMLKKPLREDAGADVLRDSTSSAHVSRKLLIPPARITHRCLSLPPLIGARELVLECVLEREFAKSLFSLPVNCMQNSTGTYPRARDPHRRLAGVQTHPLHPGSSTLCAPGLFWAGQKHCF